MLVKQQKYWRGNNYDTGTSKQKPLLSLTSIEWLTYIYSLLIIQEILMFGKSSIYNIFLTLEKAFVSLDRIEYITMASFDNLF